MRLFFSHFFAFVIILLFKVCMYLHNNIKKYLNTSHNEVKI